MTLQCPRCESTNVTRLPKSEVTPHPGYRCGDCQLKMRADGMVVLYVVGLLLGAALLAGAVFLVFESRDIRGLAKAAAVGGVCVVVFWYSLVQLLQPTPRKLDDSSVP